MKVKKPPVFLFAYANDIRNSLRLDQEEREIRQALQTMEDNTQIQRVVLGTTTIDDIYSHFNRYHDRIHIFHFAGHSDHTFLALNDLKARASNLSVLMGMSPFLKLVFLNGCANKGQVEYLLNNGIKAVIATRCVIDDKRAAIFAKAFYSGLASGKTIEESFSTASSKLGQVDPNLDLQIRDISGLGSNKPVDAIIPWGLYVSSEVDLDWKVPQPTFRGEVELTYNHPVELLDPNINKVLIETVFEGMSTFGNKFQFLWKDYLDNSSNETTIYDLQENIYRSFPSVLSKQLVDLFTIDATKEGRLRLKEIYEVYLVLTKLVCYIALADLWRVAVDREQSSTKNELFIRPEYALDLKRFIQLPNQKANHFDYVWLLATVFRILEENNEDPFLDELKSVYKSIEAADEYYTAYQFLEFTLKPGILNQNITNLDVIEMCEKSEKHIGVLLKRCAFLVDCQLVTINDISVKKIFRVLEPLFIHNKVILRGNEDTVWDKDPLPRKEFTCNGSVVITKNIESENDPLILTPFFIDENVFKLKGNNQPKIYFYSGRTPDQDLWYEHTEHLGRGWSLNLKERNQYKLNELEGLNSLFIQFIRDLNLENS